MFSQLNNIISFIIPIAAGFAGLWGFFKGVDEYIRQGAQKRQETVTQLQKQLNEDATLYKICSLLEIGTPNVELKNLPFPEKRQFLVFFEYIALLTNTNLIHKDLSAYMFGYYAARCLNNEDFWHDIPKNDQFWGLFLSYAKNMNTLISQKKLSFDGLHF